MFAPQIIDRAAPPRSESRAEGRSRRGELTNDDTFLRTMSLLKDIKELDSMLETL